MMTSRRSATFRPRRACAGAASLVLALAVAAGSVVAAQTPDEPDAVDEKNAWLEGDDEAADAAAEPAAAADPRADLSEAKARVREDDLDGAVAILERLRDEYPEDPNLLLLLGEVHVAAKRYAEGIEVLRDAAEIAPDKDRIHFQLGTALASRGEIEPALDAFAGELTRSEDPQVLVLTRINRSLLLQRLSRWSESAEELEAVLQFEPGRTNVYGDLASLFVQAGDAERAREALVRGERAGFRSAVHWYSVGALLYNEDRIDEAVEAFGRAVDLDPDRADAVRSLAAALDRLDRRDEATPLYRRYLKLRPDAPDAEKVRARLDS